MNHLRSASNLLSILLLGAGVGCGNASSSPTTGGAAGTSGTGGSGTGGSGTGGTSIGDATSVEAKLPSGAVSFVGAAAAVYGNSTKTLLRIVINEGGASCDATKGVPSAAGQHELELSLIGVAGTSAPFAAMTYSDGNVSATGVHVEGYLYTPCGNAQLAQNGGEQPYSVTLTSIDATQVTGTFTITLTEHVTAGKQFPVTGSFVAPICDHGISPVCH